MLWGFFVQFLFEIIAVLICAIISIICNMCDGIILGVIFYVLMRILIHIAPFLLPPHTQILTLVRKRISMNAINVSSSKRKIQFRNDFKRIINYCRKKKIEKITTKTHKIVLYKLIDINADEMEIEKRKFAYKKIEVKDMSIGEELDIKMYFGKMHVVRKEDIINTLSRWEYSPKELWRRKKKIMEKIKFYDVTFYID